MNIKRSCAAIAILAFLGIAVMAYLLYLHFNATSGSFCDLGAGLSCSAVNSSEYAKIMGIPLSLLGLLYFVSIAGLALFKYSAQTLKFIVFISIAFLGPSIYLSGIEYIVLKEVCIFCELSKVLIILIIAVSLAALGKKTVTNELIVGALIAAMLLGGLTYLMQKSGGVPPGTYDTFAQCLTENNLVMYGSQGCSFCAKQRAMFGDSFQYVTEIECDPRFEEHNPRPELCVRKNIEHTPTWILEDDEGNTLEAMEPGVLSLEELSELSGCKLVKDNVQ